MVQDENEDNHLDCTLSCPLSSR